MVAAQARGKAMVGLALMMFLGLFAFGSQLMGWSDPNGQVQLGIFMSFLFGIVCGYKTRG
jgi:hypothetical protein